MNKRRTKVKHSRVIQVVLSGKELKDFDCEVIRAQSNNSKVARILIINAMEVLKQDRTSPFKNNLSEWGKDNEHKDNTAE